MSNMGAYLIVNGYDDQTLCVLKVLKIVSPFCKCELCKGKRVVVLV